MRIADIEITTAARRAARKANSNPKGFVAYFDEDGHEVDFHPEGMWYANPADKPKSLFMLHCGGQVGYRVAQVIMEIAKLRRDGDEQAAMELEFALHDM